MELEKRGTTVRLATPIIECITQDPNEPAGADYLAVCTGEATEVVVSRFCQDTGCGGHPICPPCLDLALSRGLVIKREA